MYSGAFGGGKTYALCLKAIFYSIRFPDNFGLICRKTLRSMRHTTIRTFFKLCPDSYLMGGSKDEGYNKTDQIVTFYNGSQIMFAGLDDSDKLGSLEISFCGVDQAEELTEENWTMLLGRLRHTGMPRRQIFAACNPKGRSHWMYKRFFLERAGRVIKTKTLDNHFLPQDYKDSLDNFKGVFHKRFVEGEWVDYEGLVYDCFDPGIHIVQPFKVMPEWRKFRAVDFGYTNPFAAGWSVKIPQNYRETGAEHPKPGAVYIYKELYWSRRIVEDHAFTMRENSRGENFVATWADWDAEDRATLHRHGISTYPAMKDIESGIQLVYRYFKNQQLFIFSDTLIDRDPKLVHDKKPICLADELGGYMWEENKDGKPKKERPRGLDDHGCDWLRYMTMGIEYQGGLPFDFSN